jgi:hypothetical protein
MSKVALLYRIDIGFDEGRGYAAAIIDVGLGRMKGIKGNSIQQLTARLRHVLNEEMEKKRNFPMESEAAGKSSIITPEGFNGD